MSLSSGDQKGLMVDNFTQVFSTRGKSLCSCLRHAPKMGLIPKPKFCSEM